MKVLLLVSLLASLFINTSETATSVRPETIELLKDASFECESIKVDKERIGVPDFLQSNDVHSGSVHFLEVSPEMLKVEFRYSIGNFRASHTYHITDGKEFHILRDIIISEATEINDVLATDPFANSIGTLLKVEKSLLRGDIREIWLRKRLIGVKIPCRGKDVACKVKRSGQSKQFHNLYDSE